MADFAYLSLNSAIDKSKEDLERFFIDNQISPQNIAKLLIVVDEIVSNIVFYGKTEHGAFTINANITDDKLTMVFKDNGIEFNPLKQDDPDISKPVKQRDVGGLGILIVKNIADELSYERRDECNILTFKKLIEG